MDNVIQLPPLYRITWTRGTTEGLVLDESTQHPWSTRDKELAYAVIQQLIPQHVDTLFLLTSNMDAA